MVKLIALFQSYNTKEDGATAIEYGLIAAAIALAIVGVVFTLGDKVEASFTDIDAEMGKH